jgi:hypothetical protein
MATRKKGRSSWLLWSPFVLGVLATPVALHAAGMLALSGPDGLAMLYPFAAIVNSSMLKVPADLADLVSQWLMYLQFPLYGLLLGRLARSWSWFSAAGVVVLLHLIGVGVAYGLNHFENPLVRFFS